MFDVEQYRRCLQYIEDSPAKKYLKLAIAEIERQQAELSDGIAAAFNINPLRQPGDIARKTLDEQLSVLNQAVKTLTAGRVNDGKQ